jgi:hypothetical protein
MRSPGRDQGIFTERTAGSVQSENGSAGFSGKLRSFPLLDIIQMACVARRDGRLRVRRYRETGEIVLRDGRIIHAATKAKSGEPALLEVLCWTKGNFEFVPLLPSQLSPRTIAGGWEQVLMDAVRQRDELAYEKRATPETGEKSYSANLPPRPLKLRRQTSRDESRTTPLLREDEVAE